MCLYEAKISGEHLQDHWSSGSHLLCHEKHIQIEIWSNVPLKEILG